MEGRVLWMAYSISPLKAVNRGENAQSKILAALKGGKLKSERQKPRNRI